MSPMTSPRRSPMSEHGRRDGRGYIGTQSGAPRDAPGRLSDNRTVANFLGSANFLRGKVVEARMA